MKATAPITCAQCGVVSDKQTGAINLATRLGRPMYCSRACFYAARRVRTPEQRKAYMDAYRQANREKARQRAKDARYGEGRERVLNKQRESYTRNREANLIRMNDYRKRTMPERLAAIKRWLEANPEKKDIHAAKANLSQQLGIKVRDVPLDLALALVEQWKIKRWIREQAARSSTG